jgi:hypothetical protein
VASGLARRERVRPNFGATEIAKELGTSKRSVLALVAEFRRDLERLA